MQTQTVPACPRPLSPSQRAEQAARLLPYAEILCYGWDGRDTAELFRVLIGDLDVISSAPTLAELGVS